MRSLDQLAARLLGLAAAGTGRTVPGIAGVPGAGKSTLAVALVVTEGNYLLPDAPGGREARAECSETWYCESDDQLRIERLIDRHVRFGKFLPPPGPGLNAWTRRMRGWSPLPAAAPT
ncbi:pantothenate kinase [Arthrobacter sp. CAN_A214]|uniref:hypothetical protein n=1 Tax=Arthrobacter sp. CAN_A214 TaxID=2787720 RepID=UPI001A187A92